MSVQGTDMMHGSYDSYNETGYEPDSEREERLLVLHAQMWLLALTFSDSRLMPSSMSIEDILVCSFCLLWKGVVEVCEVHTLV